MTRRSNRTRPVLFGVALLLILDCLQLPAQKISAVPKNETILVHGHVLAAVDYLTGYLRGGFGDHYEVFVFGLEINSQKRPVTPVKVMYKFFFKTEPALPDSFFDFSKHYEMAISRESSCDETVQNLAYQQSADQAGKPFPPGYILRFLKGAPKGVLKLNNVFPCYILTPGKYRLLDSLPRGPSAKAQCPGQISRRPAKTQDQRISRMPEAMPIPAKLNPIRLILKQSTAVHRSDSTI